MAKKATKKKTGDKAIVRARPKVETVPYGTTAGANNPKMWDHFMKFGAYAVPGTKTIRNPDPTLCLAQTRGRGQMAYQDMLDKDPHLAGLFDTRFHAVVSAPREVLPADESPEAGDRAELVMQVLEGIDEFEESCEELLSCRINGFQVAEVEYERWSDGTVAVKKLHSVPADAIVFDLDGEPRLHASKSGTDGEELLPRKFIVMRYKATSMNPYGVGLGRSLWWYSWFKREALKFWLIFVDKFGQPTALGKYPTGWASQQAKRDEFLDVLKQIASETAVTVPEDVSVELLEATRGGAVTSYEQLLKWLDDAMARRVLGQELSSTAKDTGLNSSQGTLAGEVRQDVKERDARALKRVLQDTLVRWIVDFNYGIQDTQDYPQLHIHAEPPEDLGELIDNVGKSMDLGLRVAVKWFRGKVGIPEPEGNEPVLNDIQAKQLREQMPAGLGGPGLNEPDLGGE